jgi:hypothetical protein
MLNYSKPNMNRRIRRNYHTCHLISAMMLSLAISIYRVSAFGDNSISHGRLQNTVNSHRRHQSRKPCIFIPASLQATKNEESDAHDQMLPLVPWINEVDVQLNIKTPLQYDPEQERFVVSKQVERKKPTSILRPMLSSAFIPDGVNDSYYQYMRWRFLQRFVNANLHVIGTQSLLLGLGIKSSKLGVSAALNWVLKDALGKMARMLWASRMGRRFDSDAKRWRFRASLLFALGNYLEIVTYMMPQLFLLWATLANCFKQIAMLTSSSTRVSLYNSFRDGTRENIGDITAKGEAQIAVVDLLGIGSGVILSRFVVGTAVRNIVLTFIGLQAVEIFCMYYEIRSVQFRVLNFERLTQIIRNFVRAQPNKLLVDANANANGATQQQPPLLVPTPEEMSHNERIFLPPKHLSRRALAFGSLGRAKLSEKELARLLEIFEKERFLLVVGPSVKKRFRWFVSEPSIEEYCHIVLHEGASNADIVKSTLALTILREKLIKLDNKRDSKDHWEDIRSSHCWDILEEACAECDRLFPKFLRELSSRNWAPPSRFMFGRVHMRAQWPLQQTKTAPSKPPAGISDDDKATGKAKN